jgi:hypothetical protein
MVKKCRELNSEIVGNAAKVQTALKLSEEDQQTIVALKKEIEKAWKMVDSSHEKVGSTSNIYAYVEHMSYLLPAQAMLAPTAAACQCLQAPAMHCLGSAPSSVNAGD